MRPSLTSNGVRTDYVVDIAGSLSQVLSDGETTYLYGNGRISQTDAGSTEYFLGDALGSVRQLVDSEGEVTLAESYEPYGGSLASWGLGETNYTFTGEEYDYETGLIYLRERYYSTISTQFITQDTWEGNPLNPETYNLWLYANSNPILYIDPSGNSATCNDCLDYLSNPGNSLAMGRLYFCTLSNIDGWWQRLIKDSDRKSGAEWLSDTVTIGTQFKIIGFGLMIKWERGEFNDGNYRELMAEGYAHKYWQFVYENGDNDNIEAMRIKGSTQTVRCRIATNYGKYWLCTDGKSDVPVVPLDGPDRADDLAQDPNWWDAYIDAGQIYSEYGHQAAIYYINRPYDSANPMDGTNPTVLKLIENLVIGEESDKLIYISNTEPWTDREYIETFAQYECLKEGRTSYCPSTPNSED